MTVLIVSIRCTSRPTWDGIGIIVIAVIVYGWLLNPESMGYSGLHLYLLSMACRFLHIVNTAFLTHDVLHNEFACLT